MLRALSKAEKELKNPERAMKTYLEIMNPKFEDIQAMY